MERGNLTLGILMHSIEMGAPKEPQVPTPLPGLGRDPWVFPFLLSGSSWSVPLSEFPHLHLAERRMRLPVSSRGTAPPPHPPPRLHPTEMAGVAEPRAESKENSVMVCLLVSNKVQPCCAAVCPEPPRQCQCGRVTLRVEPVGGWLSEGFLQGFKAEVHQHFLPLLSLPVLVLADHSCPSQHLTLAMTCSNS